MGLEQIKPWQILKNFWFINNTYYHEVKHSASFQNALDKM